MVSNEGALVLLSNFQPFWACHTSTMISVDG